MVTSKAFVAIGALVALAFACTPDTSNPFDSDLTGRGSSSEESDGDGGTKVSTKVESNLPCEVTEVLTRACGTCHGETTKSGASTSLLTYEDLQKEHEGSKVVDLIKERIHSEAGRMPPAARLSDADLKILDEWIEGGAAKSRKTTCDVGEGAPPATRPFVCNAPGKVKQLKAQTPYKWTSTTEQDEYVCFGIEEEAAVKKHITAFGPMVQNANILHHILLFQAEKAEPAEPRKCDAIVGGTWKLITGWAPGGGNFEIPKEAGFPITKGTTHWVMQIHYNNAKNTPNQTDASGYQICEQEQLRPNDAGVLAFGSKKFTIPPRNNNFTVTCDYKLPARYQGVKFFGASPHMHKLGKSIGTVLMPGGQGPAKKVFEQNPFNFEQQANFMLDHIPVQPGDVMRTTCGFANTTDQSVEWGERTQDEMCFNFLNYYPAIPDQVIGPLPVQTWISPSLELPGMGPKCTAQ